VLLWEGLSSAQSARVPSLWPSRGLGGKEIVCHLKGREPPTNQNLRSVAPRREGGGSRQECPFEARPRSRQPHCLVRWQHASIRPPGFLRVPNRASCGRVFPPRKKHGRPPSGPRGDWGDKEIVCHLKGREPSTNENFSLLGGDEDAWHDAQNAAQSNTDLDEDTAALGVHSDHRSGSEKLQTNLRPKNRERTVKSGQ